MLKSGFLALQPTCSSGPWGSNKMSLSREIFQIDFITMSFSQCLFQNDFITMSFSKWLYHNVFFNIFFEMAFSKWLYQNGFIKMAQSKYPARFLLHFFSISTECCAKAEIKKKNWAIHMFHSFTFKPNYFKKQHFSSSFIHVKNGHGVLGRLAC